MELLKYKTLCSRDDVFAVLVLVYEADTEEQYLEKIKRFIAYVKLVAPEVLELYEIDNWIEAARGIAGSQYYLAIPLADFSSRGRKLREECEEYL